jgi:cyanate permease
MLVGSSVLLALVVAGLATIDAVSSFLASVSGGSPAGFAFPLLLVGYFGVRFAGQGVLTSASRNILLSWFEQRRGLVSGLRGVVVSLSFSIAPLFLALLIGSFGWRGALFVLAGISGLGFGLIALIFARDTPEACGLRIDGGDPAAPETRPARVPDRTLREASRSAVFWIYAAGLSVHALFGTAVTFHVVSIFAEAGRSQTEAFGYFFPQAVVATSVNLLASALADRFPLRPFLIAMLASFCLGAVGLLNLDGDTGYWMLIAGFGAGGGLWGVLSTLAFVRHFGLLHLGEISGLNTSLSVFGSALGPVLFSLAADGFGAYRAAVLLCLALNAGLLSAAIAIPQRDPLHSEDRRSE